MTPALDAEPKRSAFLVCFCLNCSKNPAARSPAAILKDLSASKQAKVFWFEFALIVILAVLSLIYLNFVAKIIAIVILLALLAIIFVTSGAKAKTTSKLKLEENPYKKHSKIVMHVMLSRLELISTRR